MIEGAVEDVRREENQTRCSFNQKCGGRYSRHAAPVTVTWQHLLNDVAVCGCPIIGVIETYPNISRLRRPGADNHNGIPGTLVESNRHVLEQMSSTTAAFFEVVLAVHYRSTPGELGHSQRWVVFAPPPRKDSAGQGGKAKKGSAYYACPVEESKLS